MTGIVSVYATFANADEARIIARMVVDERLAACANILGPCQSIYRWEEKVVEADEVIGIFKTGADRAAALLKRIGALHSYDLPAAVVLPVTDALEGYAEWVRRESSGEAGCDG
jgi:periplasmic divalent cation tolerance protein